MHEMILAQNKTITDLQMQIKDLITQLHKWIEHDMQKALQQQEVISLMKSYRPETNS